MKIGIITDEIDTGDLKSPQTPKQPVGFGTYTLSIVKAILKLDKKNEYYLIHRRKEEHDIYKMAKEIIVPYSQRFPFSTIRNFITLPMKINKHKLDIVHHLTSTGPFAFKHLLRSKAIETIHEIEPILYPQNFEFPVRAVFRLLLPRIARNADHIFTACNSSKMDIHRHFRVPLEKISVVYPGVNTIYKVMDRKKCLEEIRRKYGITKKFILFVSTLEAKKNIQTLLKAYRTLRDRGHAHKLVLIGKKGYGYDKIEAEIKRLKLQNDVVMPGYVPLEDLLLFYNSADVFAFPAYEGLCIPVAEAMKCGCPVVVSNGGGAPEAFGNAGIAVDVLDSEGYANAIEKVITDSKLAGALRKKSIERAKMFSWEKSARKVIETYERLGTA